MQRLKIYFSLLLIICANLVLAQNSENRPTIQAIRVSVAPEIDGILDEETWQSAKVATGFRQESPDFDTPPKFNTEVHIIYDDKAIYIGAMMYDTHPDSIKKELAVRDSDGKNADYFFIGLDTYHNKQDAYVFGVSASGIQVDQRIADITYDAVWGSAVKITNNGWVAELKIPYSAIRFPALKTQEWGLQIIRTIRRNREEDQWSLEPRDTDNTLNYWGTLTGLNDINPPLRLSILPYISAGIQHNSSPVAKNDAYSYNYNGGMDLKWGLNESFTLDMILLPDFSQVQSDEIEKNLSPFELVYDENRPFFNEGTDLFQKGDLFYSRRIGHVPINYASAYDSLRDGEHMVTNPYSSKLLNAVKLSGRTSSGLGIGVFNALTGNTYAVCEDSLKNQREILTDPLSNYNILVIDQNLPNNSSVYIINTNVTRPNGWKQSNVGGGGFKLSEKSNTYQLKFDLSLSSIKAPEYISENSSKYSKPGLFYNVEFQKTKGKFRFSLYQLAMDNKYNRNDLGVNMTNDWVDRGITLGYNIFQPFGIFRYLYQSVNFFREEKITTSENINSVITYRFNTTLKNYLSLWGSLSYSPFDRYDYYEPRLPGRFWINPGYYSGSLSFSSDYRKLFALDGDIEISKDFEETVWSYYNVKPIFRLSDKFKLTPEMTFQFGKDDKGYVNSIFDTTQSFKPLVIFGNRDIQTITNSISGEYMFNNKISLSLWVRHYWQKGEYNRYLLLTNEGNLIPNPYYTGTHDYNYNSFNIDLVFGWEFSPGSLINVVWKNAIQNEDNQYLINYFKNFDRMISSPQINNISLKVLYYLDYQMLKRTNRRP